MGQTELMAKVRELKELKLMSEELDAAITSIEDEIKAEMTARETDRLIVDVFKIQWTKVISKCFDTAAFKNSHSELYALSSRPTETRRFSIA